MSTDLHSRIGHALAPLLQRWHRLESRQQMLLGGVVFLLVFFLLLAYVWLPAVRERERLMIRLPQLNAQLNLMQRQAEEIRQLNSTTALSPVPTAAVDASALQAAFGETARVTADAGRAFRIVVPKIAYAAWWDRTSEVQAKYSLQIASLSLLSLPGTNREISVEMLLADGTRPLPLAVPTAPVTTPASPPAAAGARP